MDQNEFVQLKTFLEDQYIVLLKNLDGDVADYIPQLASNSPNSFGISVCTVDGQTINIGDYKPHFSIQSCSKPYMYCYARMLHGLEGVHSHVGFEPSGAKFNAFVLNDDGLPHNPLINAGAIMVAAQIHNKEEPSHRFEKVLQMFNKVAGIDVTDPNLDVKDTVLFDNSVYLSEKHHADRNNSLAYYMRGAGAYGDIKPSPSEIQDSLDLYFQACSIKINCSIGSRLAASLANGGINPISGETVYDINTTKDCLSLMYSCGMYDYSGQFAFDVGLPAKSGVAGCIMLVVPGKFGMCIWSPPLDKVGNSVRGVELCRRLSHCGSGDYHLFRHVGKQTKTAYSNPDVAFAILMNKIYDGNIGDVKEHIINIDVDKADYDGRTPLHIACSQGHEDIVQVLLSRGAHVHLRDRWGNTAIDELETNKAKTNGVPNVFENIIHNINSFCKENSHLNPVT